MILNKKRLYFLFFYFGSGIDAGKVVEQPYGHLPPITKTKLDEPDMQDTAGEAGASS